MLKGLYTSARRDVRQLFDQDEKRVCCVLWLASLPEGEVRALLFSGAEQSSLVQLPSEAKTLGIDKELRAAVVGEAVEASIGHPTVAHAVRPFLIDWTNLDAPSWSPIPPEEGSWRRARMRGADRALASQLPFQRWEVVHIGSYRPWVGWMIAWTDNSTTPPRRFFAEPNLIRELAHLQEPRLSAAILAAHGATDDCGDMIGRSSSIKDIVERIRQVAPHNINVLITGESGTGKEHVARNLHAMGRAKSGGDFVDLNCAAISAPMVESQLFGWDRNSGIANTGGASSKGLFRTANGGTLFLDEISEMSLETQPKILRAVEEKRIRPVNSDKTYPVNVRLVCATNKDLAEEVGRGRFREDLAHRLNVIKIDIPPLRDRVEDIRHLADFFVGQFNEEHGRTARLRPDVYARLEAYEWPGNVRELRNALERAVILAPDGDIDIAHLELPETRGARTDSSPTGVRRTAPAYQPGGRVTAMERLSQVRPADLTYLDAVSLLSSACHSDDGTRVGARNWQRSTLEGAIAIVDELSRRGHSVRGIAVAVDVSPTTFSNWRKQLRK